MGFGSERQLRADLGADGPGPGRAFFTRIVQAELRCDPQVVRGRMLEGEPAVAGARNRARPIDIELDVSRKLEINLDIGDHESPGDVTADGAELEGRCPTFPEPPSRGPLARKAAAGVVQLSWIAR